VDATERVEVTIPKRPEFVSVARLTAAAVAGRQGFAFDEIEDLKIAVSEACSAMIRGATDPADPLSLRFVLRGDALEISVETREAEPAVVESMGDDAPMDEGQLGMFVLRCLADEVDVSRSPAGTTTLRLVKRKGG
jgi:serine/threonine-protein kinase RsbW